MSGNAKYSFGDAVDPKGGGKQQRRNRRTDSEDSQDGSGSLTYSAASSINSANGESTDSSFADIMKVLDVQDTKELAVYLQKEKVGGSNSSNNRNNLQNHYNHRGRHRDERSVAESLAYSTDAESQMRSLATNDGESVLHGTDIMSTITGQTGDQFSYRDTTINSSIPADRANEATEGKDSDLDILFSPAEHADSLKKRKEQKRQKKKSQTSVETTPVRAPLPERSANNRAASDSSSRPPKSNSSLKRSSLGSSRLEMDEEEDIWYAKWWMFCFPDAKNMSPKR